jgi:hypothetical protein
VLDEARDNSSPDVSYIMSALGTRNTTGTEEQFTPVPPVTKMFNLFWEEDIVGEEEQCEVLLRVDPGLQFYMPYAINDVCSVIRVITKAGLLSAAMGAC